MSRQSLLFNILLFVSSLIHLIPLAIVICAKFSKRTEFYFRTPFSMKNFIIRFIALRLQEPLLRLFRGIFAPKNMPLPKRCSIQWSRKVYVEVPVPHGRLHSIWSPKKSPIVVINLLNRVIWFYNSTQHFATQHRHYATFFLKGKLFFSDVSSEEKKLFSSFVENLFGIYWHCIVNENFHNRLSFSLNIIEP